MTNFFGRLRSALFGDPNATIAEQHEVRGFRVIVENSRPDISTEVVLTRLYDALELIEQYQPWRLAPLGRQFHHFLVVRSPPPGASFPLKAPLTNPGPPPPPAHPAPPAASFLVDEREDGRGAPGWGRAKSRPTRGAGRGGSPRPGLGFGHALPPALGAPVIERAEASLLLSDTDVAPTIDWAEAQRRQNAIDDQARG